MVNDTTVPLISATGSTRMGKIIAQKVGARLGKTILELGGNNGIIVDKDSNMDIAIPGIVFGAIDDVLSFVLNCVLVLSYDFCFVR